MNLLAGLGAYVSLGLRWSRQEEQQWTFPVGLPFRLQLCPGRSLGPFGVLIVFRKHRCRWELIQAGFWGTQYHLRNIPECIWRPCHVAVCHAYLGCTDTELPRHDSKDCLGAGAVLEPSGVSRYGKYEPVLAAVCCGGVLG